MRTNKVLTKDQNAALRRDGFVFAPGFFSQGEMQRITAWTDEVTAWPDEGLVGEEWTPLGEGETVDMDFVAYPTRPGDAMFFDSYAPHRSGPNLTHTPRRVLYVTYNRASAGDHRIQYYADKRRSFPPDIERDPDKEYEFRV